MFTMSTLDFSSPSSPYSRNMMRNFLTKTMHMEVYPGPGVQGR